MLLAAPALQDRDLRQPALVRDGRDPLAVRRPARQKRVVLAKRQLVRLATAGRQHEEVGELAAEMRRVDEALAVRRPRRARAIERLFLVDQARLLAGHDVGFDGHAPDAARAERDAAVRDQQQLASIGRPRRREVDVVVAKVQAIAPEAMIGRDLHDGARLPVRDRNGEDVEVAVRRRRHIREPAAVRRPRRLDVDEVSGRHGRRLPRLQIEQPQIDAAPAVVGGIGEIAAVRRPFRRREVLLAVRDLLRHAVARAARDAHAPERAVHGKRQPLPVGRPGGPPRRAAPRRRQEVVVHVVAARSRVRVVLRAEPRRDQGDPDRRQERECGGPRRVAWPPS